MLQDFSSVTLRLARPSVVATERLTLRRPTLADVRTIASLANDRRVAENTRRLPHPYSQDDTVEFIRATAALGSETVFLIEHDTTPVGMVGIDCSSLETAELGYWLGVEHWGQGFGTEAARGVIDFFFEEFDALLCPPFGCAAYPHEESQDWDARRLLIDGRSTPYGAQGAWATLASMAGLPATVAPLARDADGLPLGVQIIGPYLEDRSTIALARQLGNPLG